MKRIILFFLLLAFPLFLFAQQNTYEYNQSKYDHYNKMRSKGVALIITGVALNAVGIPLYINGLKDSQYSDDWNDAANEVGKILGGIALIAVGELAIGGGITLIVIGKNKANQYKQLMQTEQKELSLNMTEQGLTLRINF